MRIALDAMGGDHAPGPIVAGALQALAADPEVTVVLVGDQARLEPLLPSDGRDRIELFHAADAIGMHDSPVDALRARPDNSIARCWQLMVGKKVDGIVSAGNTGAMVAGGLLSRRFLKGVRRPGIAAIMPTVSAAWNNSSRSRGAPAVRSGSTRARSPTRTTVTSGSAATA